MNIPSLRSLTLVSLLKATNSPICHHQRRDSALEVSDGFDLHFSGFLYLICALQASYRVNTTYRAPSISHYGHYHLLRLHFVDSTLAQTMLPIVDFPSEVLSQIFGSKYSSYLVIKIWLCGSSTLNKKLSNGLTYLDLALHQFATCRFPRLVFEFYNLRHFAISSSTFLRQSVHRQSDWTHIMKSLPKTLVSLHLDCPDSQHCLSDFEANEENPPALNIASLLPCLQTLNIRESIPSDRFAFLPPTLTDLTADIQLPYNSPDTSLCRPLSQLPRGLLRLNGDLRWCVLDAWKREMPEAIELLRADLLNVPPHLQYFPTTSLPTQVMNEDFRFPKSLTAITMARIRCLHWTPLSALQVPPNSLHTLEISVDMRLFATSHTNWVSELPRSLTNLVVKVELFAIEFTSFSHCLPPKLTHLSFLDETTSDSRPPLGDWSCIDTNDVENGNHWPKSLTSLKLGSCLSSSFDLAKLPSTLLNLNMATSKYSHWVAEPVLIDSERLPPLLTELTLASEKPLQIQLCNLQCLTKLQDCRLSGNIVQSEDASSPSDPSEPSAVSALSMTSLYTSQHLTALLVPTWHCDCFKLLPRGLKHLEIYDIFGLVTSPLLATHDVFKDLPTSLISLALRFRDSEFETYDDDWEYVEPTPPPKIPPQRLDHLSSLCTLIMEAAIVPSAMIRMLPASLLTLQLQIEEWNESDHLHFPPRIELLLIPLTNAPMAQIFQSLPLVTLNGLGRISGLSSSDKIAIRQRIAQVVKDP